MDDDPARQLTPVAAERGASLVEYALLVALIAVVSITSVRFLGNRVSASLETASLKVEDAGAVPPPVSTPRVRTPYIPR